MQKMVLWLTRCEQNASTATAALVGRQGDAVAQQRHRWAHLNLNILASRAGLRLHLLPSKLGSHLMGTPRTKFSLPIHHFVQLSLHVLLPILQTLQLIKSIF
jgi:hypothetical protein